jgi:hypothetical protein
MREWDTIGVKDVPEAQDEYDRYADKAYVMLMDERQSVEEIAAYLLDIESQWMGLGDTPAARRRSRRTAETLYSMLPEFEAESNDPY